MTSNATTFDDFLSMWATGERTNDAQAMTNHITDDFRMVGPLGFVLNREQWLQRYASGDLVNASFDFEDVQPRTYGDTIVAIGVQNQATTYKGQANNGRFRITMVLVRQDGELKLAGYHLSPVTPIPDQSR